MAVAQRGERRFRSLGSTLQTGDAGSNPARYIEQVAETPSELSPEGNDAENQRPNPNRLRTGRISTRSSNHNLPVAQKRKIAGVSRW